MRGGAALAILLAVTLASVPLPRTAHASTLRVSPVGLDLPPGQNAATLSLFNNDVAALNVQVRVFRWSQREGREVLEPATGVVVSPPMAKLAPGAARSVRVVRLDPKLPERQEAYRLIVDELPPPLAEGGRSVTLLMRHSIPLFFAASGDRAKVEWRLIQLEGGPALVASNTGGRHLRIANLRIRDATGAVLAERKGLVGYALPGSEMTWPIGAFQATPGLHLTADTDAGPIDAPLLGN
jgi:fimbrial chaperone protein